jgi:hypothetical protein
MAGAMGAPAWRPHQPDGHGQHDALNAVRHHLHRAGEGHGTCDRVQVDSITPWASASREAPGRPTASTETALGAQVSSNHMLVLAVAAVRRGHGLCYAIGQRARRMPSTPVAMRPALEPRHGIGTMTAIARGLLVSLTFLAQVTAPAAQEPAVPAPSPATPAMRESWQSFEASISASGRREALAVEDGRTALVLRLSGALVMTGNGGLGKGFQAEFLGFDDGNGTGTARAVWTDDNGDRIFSRMVGAQMQTGRRTAATITGGTGRYAGISGTYTFGWQYIMPGEQEVVQVRVSSMKGRYRLESSR